MLAKFNARLQSAAVAATLAATGLLGTAAQAASVFPGFDLFLTIQEGSFLRLPGGEAIPFKTAPNKIGDPLCGARSFDFGDGGGCRDTFLADTIVQRLGTADTTTGSESTIPVSIVGLSLISAVPFSPGPGFEPELVEARVLKDLNTGDWIYGNDWGSTMTINFAPTSDGADGTFTSILDFRVDLFGHKSGVYLGFKDLLLDTLEQPAKWCHDPIDCIAGGGARLVQIDGINRRLNGVNRQNDFWVVEAIHITPDAGHVVVPAPIPVPAALPLLATALGALGLVRRRRRA